MDPVTPKRPYYVYESDACSIARTLEQIGDRWALLILRDVANGVRRFDQLTDHLGIARNVLSRRLATLTEFGRKSPTPSPSRSTRTAASMLPGLSTS